MRGDTLRPKEESARQYRTLGRTGMQVSSLVLGAMNFGRIGNTTQEEAIAIVDATLGAGINLIDTADLYSGGQSEEMVGTPLPVAATTSGWPRRQTC